MMDLFRLYCLLMVARVALVLMLVERVASLMVYLVAALAAYMAWFGHDWYALRALHVVFVANTLAGVLLWHILMPGGLLWMSAMQLMMATLLFMCVAGVAWYVWAVFLDKR